jgi:hypothetical protein
LNDVGEMIIEEKIMNLNDLKEPILNKDLGDTNLGSQF